MDRLARRWPWTQTRWNVLRHNLGFPRYFRLLPYLETVFAQNRVTPAHPFASGKRSTKVLSESSNPLPDKALSWTRLEQTACPVPMEGAAREVYDPQGECRDLGSVLNFPEKADS